VGTRLLDRRHLATAACLILAFPAAGEELFNGRNLDGWYTWLRATKHEDPKKVFSVADGAVRISGEDWGGIATRKTYRDYHLIVEWKWGGKTWGDRASKARDSGILVHAVGEDGAASGVWLESIESQIIEGGTGDFILVAGKGRPWLTVEARKDAKGETYWHYGAAPITRDRGRFNWFGRDPAWRDVINFRGANEVEKPVGEWNRHEIVCAGATITTVLNGIIVNRGTQSSHTEGKIQIQSEGAEILVRKVELRPLR
jgi:hypothetical protein